MNLNFGKQYKQLIKQKLKTKVMAVDYRMLQLSVESHKMLKEYCKESGYKMSALVEKLIQKEIKESKDKKDSE